MRIGSLCSGAGGLDMAVEQVFGATTAWHCEIDDAASKVLAHRWPGVPNHRDLTTTDWDSVEPVDILTGGYPCQPFSHAGRRKGTSDERHIWPHVREAIRRVRPRITFLENVAGHRSLGFDRVLGDLAEDGMHVRWTSVRASDVGAPHRRERLFILVTPADASDPARDGQWSRAEPRQGSAADVDLLPTPSAADGGGGHLTRSGDRGGELLLPGIARAYGNGDLLPTPTSRDHKGRNQRDDATCLTGALLPTPSASDTSKHSGQPPEKRVGHATRLTDVTEHLDAYALLPTPAAADGERGPDYARAGREGSGGDDLVTICARATHERGSRWGKYADAITRWESVVGPAPSPTEPNRNGNPRLNPEFSSWMMGWPTGWVTQVPGISRNDQLRIIGNGVVPQQAVSALSWLLSVSEVAA